MNIEVVCFTGDSGLTDYSVSLCRSLLKHGCVSLVTANSLPNQFANMGFKVERVFRRSRHFPIDILFFLIGMYKRKPDWVIFQGPLKVAAMDAFVVKICQLFGIRCAITVHDVLPHYPKKWSPHEFGFYYRSFDKVIAHSEAAAKALICMGITKPLLIVPHGVYDIFNINNYRKSEAHKFFPSIIPGSTTVLFFGNLESRKGLWEFINAAQYFSGCSDFTFIIAGASHLNNSGAEAEVRLKNAKHLKNLIIHDKRIEFDSVEQYFAVADIIALPYREGTTSGVLKLALAFGKPVVATTVGDFPEQVPVGAGIFIDPDHIDAELSQALINMRENLELHTTAMQQINSQAQWPDIAMRVYDFLKADSDAKLT